MRTKFLVLVGLLLLMASCQREKSCCEGNGIRCTLKTLNKDYGYMNDMIKGPADQFNDTTFNAYSTSMKECIKELEGRIEEMTPEELEDYQELKSKSEMLMQREIARNF